MSRSSTEHIGLFGAHLALIGLAPLLIGGIAGWLLGIGSRGMGVVGVAVWTALLLSFATRLVRGALTGQS